MLQVKKQGEFVKEGSGSLFHAVVREALAAPWHTQAKEECLFPQAVTILNMVLA